MQRHQDDVKEMVRKTASDPMLEGATSSNPCSQAKQLLSRALTDAEVNTDPALTPNKDH